VLNSSGDDHETRIFVSQIRPRDRLSRTPGIARHGRLARRNPFGTILKFVAAALAVVMVSGASVAVITLAKFDSSIKTVTLANETDGPPPELGAYDGGFNVLLVGSDSRAGSGEKGPSSVLNDVNILLHVSEDQTNAVAVSIPRDLIVPIPACPTEDGKGSYSAMSAQPLNSTLGYGGLPCTVLTVESLTGLKIPFAGLITFRGVTDVSTAIGGVPVCVNGPFHDSFTNFSLPKAGTYSLKGKNALKFLRSRHGVGDGSDLGRISSQQVFLSSLVRTVKSSDTLTDFSKVFNIATVVSKSMTLSNSLKNINTMVAMAQVLRKLPLDRIMFVQYPGTTGGTGLYANKVRPDSYRATALFDMIKADEPFSLKQGDTGRGSVSDPNAPKPTPSSPTSSASPAPSGSATPSSSATASPSATPEQNAGPELLDGVQGQSAADYTCSKVNN
jgi:LCP family protein required for cell wall assembly